MKKLFLIALFVGSLGLMGASTAQAGCGCTNSAAAPTTQVSRSYSYEPAMSSSMRRYSGSNPQFRADRKAMGK